MKSSLKLPLKPLAGLIALGVFAVSSTPAHALTWFDAHATNTWQGPAGAFNWDSGASQWVQGGAAVFSGAGESVSIGANLTISSLTFDPGAGSYPLTNTGGFQIDFTGTGITNNSGPQSISTDGFINFNGASSADDISITSTSEIHFLGTSTAASSTITSDSVISFEASSTAGSSVINNTGSLTFLDSSSGGTATVSNGNLLFLDNNPNLIGPGPTGTITMGSLTNTLGGSAGTVVLGRKTLVVGNLTLGNGDGLNTIDFTLAAPGTSGTIFLTGGSTFTGSGAGQVDIALSSFGLVQAGTYVLIDWTSAESSALGVELSDFNPLGTLPPGLSGAQLVLQGNQLLLVAVPEPATLAMPLMGVLGMVWLRRRASRMAVVS